MWDSFIKSIQATDFEDYGTFSIDSVNFKDDQLGMSCVISLDDDQAMRSKWKIICSEVWQHRIALGSVDSIEFSTDHVLLWPFREARARLGFKGKVPDANSVVGALYEKHFEVVGNWFAFDEFMVSDWGPKRVLDSSFGIFAEGPLNLVSEYQKILQNFGVDTAITGHNAPLHWNGSERAPYVGGAVLIFDDSFIIAESFDAQSI